MRPNILKAARELLQLSQEALSARSGVPISTLKRIEAPGNTKRTSIATIERLERFFRTQGVVTIDRPDRTGVFIDRSGELAQLAAILDARDRQAGMYDDGETLDDMHDE